MRPFRTVLKAAAVVAAIISTSVHAAWPRYRVEAFSPLSTFGSSYVFDMNNLGQVVGFSRPDGPASFPHPFMYDAGRVVDLRPIVGQDRLVSAINDRGDLSGGGAALLYRDGKVIDLTEGLAPGSGVVHAINQAGHAAGLYEFDTEPGSGHPFYHDGRSPHVIPGRVGKFDAINDHDVMVSWGYIYDHGNVTSIPFAEPWNLDIYPTAINNAGVVVGVVTSLGHSDRPFLYSDGKTRILTGIGSTSGQAYDINDQGRVVGSVWTHDGSEAFLWTNGDMVNVESLLVPRDRGQWDFDEALRINERGQILISRVSGPGFQHAVLTPVPESYAWVLMLTGLGALNLATRCKRKLSAGHGVSVKAP